MRDFDEIFEIAAQRKGGADALNALLNKPESAAALAAFPEDRWLAQISKCVFNAGFNWKVIEAKWPGFEEAFDGFDPARVAMWPDERLDQLASDTRIVRNGSKIASVHANAVFLRELAQEHGSASAFFAAYPADDQIDLMEILKKRGSRLGGSTVQYALRFMGKESFVLSRDVVKALRRENVIASDSLSKKNLIAIQAAFNNWKAETGRPLNEISRILAFSVGTPD